MKSQLIFLLILGFLSESSRAQTNDMQSSGSTSSMPVWLIKLPKEEKVPFKGIVNFDNAGASSSAMLYPAPNAIGFLAAVITHGLMNEAAKNSQKEKMQQDADKILSSYQTVLNNFKYGELIKQAINSPSLAGKVDIAQSAEKTNKNYDVESSPIFSISQDQTTIVLDNTFLVKSNDAKIKTNELHIHIVSNPEHQDDLTGYWTNNEGQKIKEQSAKLVTESLEIALNQYNINENSTDKPQKTVRYMEGGVEKMERAIVLEQSCQRLIMKNLRGWILSVPTKPSSDTQVTTSNNSTPSCIAQVATK